MFNKFFSFLVTYQEAMKAQSIEFKEIDSDHLGSDQEKKVPPGKSTSGGTANSWRQLVE